MPAALTLGLSPVIASAQEHKNNGAHLWTYGGVHGPEHWAELDPQFAACKNGKWESPIDIKGATPSELAPLVFNYSATPLTVVDNGHTVMVTYAPSI